MQKNLRELFKLETNAIIIDNMWPALRQRQYYNAMCDLKHELEVLAFLPNIAKDLKKKVIRSLEQINIIVSKLKEKN
jgi:hypothetical protein